MLGALALAYVIPWELLLLAYVVLGPAHYTTEISWLHDRKYFLPRGVLAFGLVAVAIAATLIEEPTWFGLVMWGAFVACALATAGSAVQLVVLSIAAIGATWLMLSTGLAMAVMGILLPTFIHVSLFTLVFMALGALRSGERFQWALVAAYLSSVALILAAPPSAGSYVPSFARAANDYFGNVAPALSRLFQVPNVTLDGRLAGLLAFLYTYHYLNWFVKADVIRWNIMSPPRLAIVAGTSLAATALYFHDYAYGFTVLLALSLAHIVLEFPLNNIALRQLGGEIGKRMGMLVSEPAPVGKAVERPGGKKGGRKGTR